MTTLSSGDSRLRAGPGTYAGLFVITLATLMFEIALTRIFSATMWYHFAFVAISVALFGLTVGALVVHTYPHRFDEAAVRDRLWQYALLFGITLVACFAAQLSIPFVPEPTAGGALSVFLTCVVVSIPFVCSGVVVSLALTRFPSEVNRLYATDLVGAALGCLVLVALFVFLDGPSLIVGIGALAAVGALLFAAGARSPHGVAFALVVAVVLGGFCALNTTARGRGEPILRILWAKEEPDPVHAYETWNAFSRITVDPLADGPAHPRAVGMSPTLPSDLRAEELEMLIDSNAATVLTRYSGRPEETDHLRYNVINLAHWIRKDADVLVIGAGGGRDVLSALEFGQRSVTAVEINGRVLEAVNGTYGEFTGHLDRDPRVRFVNDEARSYLARTDRKYDVIQISLVDTWAATAAGAFALSENSLYTTQAWDLFLDRLAPGGVISVARWFTTPGRGTPLETYRALALAAQVLTHRGVARPRDHILLYRGPDRGGVSHATLLVSPQPFSNADTATLTRETERLEFTPVLTRTVSADEHFAALSAPGGPGPAVADFSIDVSPPSDDRPFFFQMARLESLFAGDDDAGDLLQPVFVLAILAVTVLILTSSFITVPLLLTTDRLAHRGMLPFYLYFAGIGLGFLLVEISQLQRLSVFLGHPVYALTVVLFSLLVFSGIGSMVSGRLADPVRGAWRVVPLLAALAVVGACGLLTPRAIEAMDGATTPVRIGTAVALLAPLGFVLGMPFAIGMRAASTRPNAPTAFLWGLNGATSVCASVFAVVIAVFFGISAAYWTGFAAYALAAAALVTIAVPQQGLRSDPI